jgi:hypothetical protein
LKENLKRFIKFFSLAFTVLLLPWLLQVILCPADQVPTGMLLEWQDYWTFITKTEWGRLGNWSYTNQLTPETTEPAPIYFFYLLLGHLAKWTGLSAMWVYHLGRSTLGAIFLWMWWSFCRRHTKHALVTAILGIFASFGFLGHLPIAKAEYLELCVQAHAAQTGLIGFPHYTLDGIAFLLLLEAYITGKLVVIRSLLAGALLGMVHPFLLILLPVVFIVHSFLKRSLPAAFKISFWAALGSLPFVVPMILAFMSKPWLTTWREQTAMSFTWWETIIMLSLTFGLAGIVAWIRLPNALRGDKLQQVSAIWMVAAALLVFFAPLTNNREYVFFLSIPVSIIAIPAFIKFAKRKSILLVLMLISCGFGAGLTIESYFPSTLSYMPREVIAGLNWLEGQPPSVVASTPNVGLMIPYYAGQKPWAAHVAETVDYQHKTKQVEEFFNNHMLIPADYAVKIKGQQIPDLPWEPVYQNTKIKIWEIPKRGDTY